MFLDRSGYACVSRSIQMYQRIHGSRRRLAGVRSALELALCYTLHCPWACPLLYTTLPPLVLKGAYSGRLHWFVILPFLFFISFLKLYLFKIFLEKVGNWKILFFPGFAHIDACMFPTFFIFGTFCYVLSCFNYYLSVLPYYLITLVHLWYYLYFQTLKLLKYVVFSYLIIIYY